MEEKRYLISDAAKLAGVEAHVLRYWEEELDLSIGRTELGHRYYTRENIETFQRIKELKEKGLQLKAIREILKKNASEMIDASGAFTQPDGQKNERIDEQGKALHHRPEISKELHEKRDGPDSCRGEDKSGADGCPGEDKEKKEGQTASQEDSRELLALQENTEKLRRFEALVSSIVDRVVRENNEELEQHIEEAFSRNLDELVRFQELQEEARFRRLDEAIRLHQMAGREAAAAREGGFLRRWLEKWKRA